MILVDTKYAGQLNVPDMFTRMMLSLVPTGIAPGSFYETAKDGKGNERTTTGCPWTSSPRRYPPSANRWWAG